MIETKIRIYTLLLIIISLLSCNLKKDNNIEAINKYVPDDNELYEAIVSMDKEYFDAYNICDLEKQASIYSENIEFYHDQGGLTTSKEELMKAIEKNVCGKVTRELVQGSIEVYPIKGYGAVEIGFHKFYNNQEPEAKSEPSKFIIIWKKENDKWKIGRVISLH